MSLTIPLILLRPLLDGFTSIRGDFLQRPALSILHPMEEDLFYSLFRFVPPFSLLLPSVTGRARGFVPGIT